MDPISHNKTCWPPFPGRKCKVESHLLCLAHQIDELGLQDGAERGKLAVTAAEAKGGQGIIEGYSGLQGLRYRSGALLLT